LTAKEYSTNDIAADDVSKPSTKNVDACSYMSSSVKPEIRKGNECLVRMWGTAVRFAV
jgi:hypothetical protein